MSAGPDGILRSINVSNGGVPKHARFSAHVHAHGVEGDQQRDLRYHGGPDRAVSLYSLDRIRALQEEGHPIVPGSIGENLTLEGLDWSRLRPGVRLTIGNVRLEITKAVPPCRTIAASFVDGDFGRVSQKTHAGWSRFYCRVLTEGNVTVGDRVVMEDAADSTLDGDGRTV